MSKICAFRYLSGLSTIPVIRGVFHLTFVRNTGIAFGLLQGHNKFLFVCNIVISLFILFLFLKTEEKRTRPALFLILTGAWGNILDRVFYGTVIDFFDFLIWPVFNFSDAYITAGAAVILTLSFLKPEKTNAGEKKLSN